MSTSIAATPWLRRGLVLTAGVAASLAMGATGTPAEAGTDAEWNRLADCESGQRWSINTGNGYYGGLQFSKGSWDWAGGTKYAAHPHQATRAEQIAVAERLLDLQHISNAWPACSAKLGMSHAALQSGSATAPGGGSGGDTGGGSSDDGSSNDGGSRSGWAGTYRVRSGDTLSSIARAEGIAGGWSAIWNNNRDRLSNPSLIHVGQVLRVPGQATGGSGDGGSNEGGGSGDGDQADQATYRVRAGDTLSGIARNHGVPGGWNALYEANRDRVTNANVIYVGQVLRLP